MASTLKHLRSSTADKRPTASGLVDGQLAINTASGTPALFFKDNNGGVVKVGPAHVGSTAPNAVPAGSAGNSLGELWVNNGLTTPGLNYYTGSAFVNLTPSGTTTTVGLVELATPAETQTGTDAVRAVTPSGLQSKVSDSTSTTSSTTIASSTAVKSAYDLANAALPKAGGTVTGELLIGNTGSLVFEGSSDDSFETTIAVVDPTGDRTITFPNVTGTVVTTGDSGTVTSTMIANDTIVNADINSAAAIAYSKLALSSGIVNTDISASAAIVDTKLATISTADKVSISALDIDGATDIGGALEGGDLFVVDDGAGGTNRKAPAFRMSQLVYSGVTGDIAIASGGTASISAGVIVNADINSSAAIDFSKLASLTSANILLGNASNVATSTAVTGDVTISNTGVTAIASGAIVDADISASAEIAVSKLADGAARQLLQTDAAGTGVEWASNIDIPGTLDVTSAATFDSTIGASAGTASLPSITFTGDLNTGIYSPGADQVAISTNGSGRLFVDASGRIGAGVASPGYPLDLVSQSGESIRIRGTSGTEVGKLLFTSNSAGADYGWLSSASSYLAFGTAATERMRLTSTGLGVGTSTPGYPLTVNGRISYAGAIGEGADTTLSSSSTTLIVGESATWQNLALRTNGSTRLYINSSGSVGIGTSSPGSNLEVVGGTSTDGPGAELRLSSADQTIAAADEIIGSITFKNNDVSSGMTGYMAKIDAASNRLFDGDPASGMNLRFFAGTAADGVNAPPERMRLTSAGRLGIGTTSPAYNLDVNGQIRLNNDLLVADATATRGRIYGDSTGVIYRAESGLATRFMHVGTELARITSSGQLLVGTSTSAVSYSDWRLQISGQAALGSYLGATTSAYNFNFIKSRSSSVGTYTIVASGDKIGGISFNGDDGTDYETPAASIEAFVDGTPGVNDMPGRLVFSVTRDGQASPTEALRIANTGAITHTSDRDAFQFSVVNTASVYASRLIFGRTTQTNSSSFYYLNFQSGNGADDEFILRGDGNAYADGSWNGGGADYAEYFEWSDSNPNAEDRRGISVVLNGNKIREAIAGEDPIGVISGNPSVVGDAAWNKWSGKYLRDEFGTYIQEDYEVEDEDGNTVVQQRRKLNPAYDPDQEYVSREQRPEWDCVGLMGKLRIRKGQVTGARWIKMRDISDSVEEWLVR